MTGQLERVPFGSSNDTIRPEESWHKVHDPRRPCGLGSGHFNASSSMDRNQAGKIHVQ
jgi:hypothetical protein